MLYILEYASLLCVEVYFYKFYIYATDMFRCASEPLIGWFIDLDFWVDPEDEVMSKIAAWHCLCKQNLTSECITN